MIDLDPTVIDEIRSGQFSKLFDSKQFVSRNEIASDSYSTDRRVLLDTSQDRIRKLIEECSDFQGFHYFGSVGGSTGSGLGTQLLETLSHDYEKKQKNAFIVYPSLKHSATSVLTPYNASWATHKLIEHTNIAFMLENEAIHGICTDVLGLKRPTYANMNRLIAKVVSSTTVPLRKPGNSFDPDLIEYQSSLVMRPRLHFITTGLAPIMNQKKLDKTSISDW